MANRRRRVSLPAWTNHVCDTEVAVELSFMLAGDVANGKVPVDDSRCHFLLVQDMHDIFVKRHKSMCRRYWDNQDFYEHVVAVYDTFAECLQREPDWINTKFHAMLGVDADQLGPVKEHVQHLFKRYPYIVEMHEASAQGNPPPEKK